MDRYRVRLDIVVDKEVLADSPADAIQEAKAILRYVLQGQCQHLDSLYAIAVRKQGTPIDCRAEFAAVVGQSEVGNCATNTCRADCSHRHEIP